MTAEERTGFLFLFMLEGFLFIVGLTLWFWRYDIKTRLFRCQWYLQLMTATCVFSFFNRGNGRVAVGSSGNVINMDTEEEYTEILLTFDADFSDPDLHLQLVSLSGQLQQHLSGQWNALYLSLDDAWSLLSDHSTNFVVSWRLYIQNVLEDAQETFWANGKGSF